MPTAPRLHRAWLVAAVTLGALVAAAAFRSSVGVLLEPIESTFGWSRATTSGAVSLNLVLYGLTAPFAAAIMERFGVRRVVAAALAMVGTGSLLTTVMTAPWQLWLLWGCLVGVGTGSMALVFGAIVANRWFEARRGLVTGVFSSANASGQLVFLPLIAAAATGPGWRWAAAGVAALAFAMIPLVTGLLVDHPHQVGLRPFGADPGPAPGPATDRGTATGLQVSLDEPTPKPQTPAEPKPVALALGTLRDAARTWTFWALAATFWVCGWSTNGLVQTHFVPAAHDHGMPATTAAGLLAVVGAFDIAGTICSGWLTDRFDSRVLLAGYYGMRGVSLLALPFIMAPHVQPSLWFFIVFYGLDWVATVPPTVALCRQHFGLQRSGVVFGWVFASHMVGAGVGASFAGWIRTAQGDYRLAWWSAAALCLLAAVTALTIRRPRRPAPAPSVERIAPRN